MYAVNFIKKKKKDLCSKNVILLKLHVGDVFKRHISSQRKKKFLQTKLEVNFFNNEALSC